jgi:hypothetical protein
MESLDEGLLILFLTADLFGNMGFYGKEGFHPIHKSVSMKGG